jgi:iron complex outermembrane receptor protein/vitamin B12 transporter
MKSFARGIGVFVLSLLVTQVYASSAAIVSGTITDSLGAVIRDAKVELVENGGTKVLQSTKTDENGRYSFEVASEIRFCIRAEKASFQPAVSAQRFAGGAHSTEINLTLSPSMVAQQIVVTATGVPTPEVQTGALISVIGEEDLMTRRDVEQELRIQPGAQVTRSGQLGGTTSLFVRGGPSDANKVLIDGIPANDIGGNFEFANLSASGFGKAELFRGPNSALYGSDALGSVLNVSTRRGVTPLPEVSYSVDGGTYGTSGQDGTLGGAWRRFDYFTDVSRFDTQNSTPNSEFHNGSFLGNVGYQLLPGTELRGTVRRSVSAFNSASAIELYEIPDDGVSREQDTSFGVTLDNRASERWHNLVRYSGLRLRSEYRNFGPTGIPTLDPYGEEIYLGKTVTLRGANGYEVTGQGILQYGPGAYSTAGLSDRDSIYAQSDFKWSSKLAGLFGFRYESEGGYTTSSYAKNSTARGNYSYMMQLNGGLWNRLYYTVGSGVENNSVFGVATTPRASLSYYLVQPTRKLLSGTRLVFNFGKGIKEPTIYYQTNSLYSLLQSLPNGQQLIAEYGIHPFKDENSRSYDGGVQQMLLRGKASVSLTYFHNEFGDQAEFVPSYGLLQFGVPQAVIDQMQTSFLTGAAVNSLDYRAQGSELEVEYHITHALTVRGGWTYLDAQVQRSFSGSLANASQNPSIPNVLIGAYSPLVGARPFRIAPNTGFISVDWSGRRWSVRSTASMVSRRDDSTFLEDSSYGNSMLLPNRNLDPSYQKVDLYGSFRLSKRVSAYTNIENLLNQHYSEAFGYPALPFTVRAGMQFRFGGENWKLQ